MSSIKRFYPLIFLLPLMPGCQMLQTQNTQRARTSHEVVQLRREVRMLNESVRAMQASREDLYGRVDAAERNSVAKSREQEEEITKLRAEIKALRAEREAMRAQLVKELSAKMASAMQNYAAQSAPPQQSGRLHKVEAGQTLSEIARAYGVSVPAIMKANKLRSANVLKIGQELFIPE